MDSVEARSMLSTLGACLPVISSTIESMEMFTIRYIYNDHVSKNLAEACANKWRKMRVKAMQRLPLTPIRTLSMSLEWTIRCIRYLNAMNPMLLHILLVMAGLWTDGICQPQRVTAPSLPTSLQHICTTAEQLKTHAKDEDADSIADAESIEQDDFLVMTKN